MTYFVLIWLEFDVSADSESDQSDNENNSSNRQRNRPQQRQEKNSENGKENEGFFFFFFNYTNKFIIWISNSKIFCFALLEQNTDWNWFIFWILFCFIEAERN